MLLILVTCYLFLHATKLEWKYIYIYIYIYFDLPNNFLAGPNRQITTTNIP
jgi:hypothetical protein